MVGVQEPTLGGSDDKVRLCFGGLGLANESGGWSGFASMGAHGQMRGGSKEKVGVDEMMGRRRGRREGVLYLMWTPP